jgi:hypothetical protein
MNNFYKHFPEIDSVFWTEYFLNEFIPKYKFHDKLDEYNYVQYDHKNQYPGIVKLNSLLMKKLKFPPIEYLLIFKHRNGNQPIHADGLKVLRNTSFNLPLIGYEETKMNFYEKKNINIETKITNANYYNLEDVVLVEQLSGGNEWVLVNSSVPHNIVSVNKEKPRMTVCLRFIGNPRFESLVNNAKS